MANNKGSGEPHRHECPLCLITFQCAAPLPHRVGHPPKFEIKMSGERPATQRYKVCARCARRKMGQKDLKGTVGGDVAILAQLLELGWPSRNPVDVLAEASVSRARPFVDALRDQLKRESENVRAAAAAMDGYFYGRTKKEARRLALFAYLDAPRDERDAVRAVIRKYPMAGFPSPRAFIQAAYRLRKKLAR